MEQQTVVESQAEIEPVADNKPVDNVNEPLGYENEDVFTVVTCDGQTFKVTVGAARYSKTLRDLLKDTDISAKDKDGNVAAIPLPSVYADQFAKILLFLNEYSANPPFEDKHTYGGEDREVLNTKLTDFDKAWVEYDGEWPQNRLDTLAHLMTAADFLDTREVLNVIAQTIADKIRDKTEAEFIKIFNIKPEQLPTAEERAIIEKKYAFLKSD